MVGGPKETQDQAIGSPDSFGAASSQARAEHLKSSPVLEILEQLKDGRGGTVPERAELIRSLAPAIKKELNE